MQNSTKIPWILISIYYCFLFLSRNAYRASIALLLVIMVCFVMTDASYFASVSSENIEPIQDSLKHCWILLLFCCVSFDLIFRRKNV